MKIIQGHTGKSDVLKSMLKEDLEKVDVWLIDTVGIPLVYRNYDAKGQLYKTALTGLDFDNLGVMEDRLNEGLASEELGEVGKIYLSINAPQDSIKTLREIESSIGVDLVVTIQTSKGMLKDKVLVSEIPTIKDDKTEIL